MTSSHPFDIDALSWFATRTDPLMALRVSWIDSAWNDGVDAIHRLFDLDRDQHFLKHHRGILPQLWERQITQAIRSMLMEVPDSKIARCQALLDALYGAASPRIASVDAISADADDRMDLAIYFRTRSGEKECLVIEAKLDSELSDTQLEKYRDHLKRAKTKLAKRYLWVVAPVRTQRTATIMDRSPNREWNFITWRRLLINWQRSLGAEAGNDLLSLFSEIWKRIGGR